MNGKLRLKLIACYRGDAAKSVSIHVRESVAASKGKKLYRITAGPRRGCFRASAMAGGGKVNVYKLSPDCVLELRPCVRIEP